LKLSDGANDLKIFAISDSVLRPDVYSQGFLALAGTAELPEVSTMEFIEDREKDDYFGIFSIVIGVIIVSLIMYFRRARKRSKYLQS
jgi:peptide/nickel transport system substrate-binding protein